MKSSAFSGWKQTYLKFLDLLKVILLFYNIFLVVNGGGPQLDTIFIKKIEAISELWLFLYCIKLEFWSEILKKHIKKTVLGRI